MSTSVGRTAASTARDVHRSGAVEALARLGLAARGLVWLVVGLLAVSVARGGRARADQQGALRALADRPFGEVLLAVLAVGFVGYALWQALVAATGRQEARERAGSGAKALVYGVLAGSVVRFLAGSGQQSGDPAPSLTARLMRQPGGRWLVVAAGLAVVALGAWLVLRALRREHADKIECWRLGAGRTRAVLGLGTVGLTGRGLVVALVGAFLVRAGVQADPREARGLDAALHELAQQPYGTVLLGVAAGGLLAYAAWSFAEAVLHRHSESAA